jgi:hypothetical protein
MSQESERHPLLAAALSALQPGVGHLYLREPFRACMWAGIWLGSLALVVATAGVDLAAAESVALALGVFPVAEGFPFEAVLSMVAVTAFATLDAYWLAGRNNHRLRDGVGRCPHCGRELDPTLEFCHWCTEPRENDETV